MELTCAQMDVLISFYIDGDLSKSLKTQVESHLKQCSSCKAKYDIIKTMILDIKNDLSNSDALENNLKDESVFDQKQVTSQHYRVFRSNLSAYVDNELPTEETIKIKKYTINNKKAREELENCYNLRRLMNDSLNKAKSDIKQDFTRSVLKQLELKEEDILGIHPAIKLFIGFTLSVMVITLIVLFSLTI